MVEAQTQLRGDLTAGIDKFEVLIKASVLLSGAAAMAGVLYDELLVQTSPPKIGRVTGNLNEAVYRYYAKDKSSDTEKVYHISIRKSQAPHWALLEYGTSKMTARAPIRKTLDRIEEAGRAGIERMKERMVGL